MFSKQLWNFQTHQKNVCTRRYREISRQTGEPCSLGWHRKAKRFPPGTGFGGKDDHFISHLFMNSVLDSSVLFSDRVSSSIPGWSRTFSLPVSASQVLGNRQEFLFLTLLHLQICLDDTDFRSRRGRDKANICLSDFIGGASESKLLIPWESFPNFN